jgi:uncharacterized protein (TIGR02996 family)
MSDENALLDAIWEHPHEDTPRLMYADWLDEHGQLERARFIRLQCELARLDDDDSSRPGLLKRESGLWNAHRRLYRQGLPERLRQYPFQRGFVAPPAQTLTGHQFLKVFWDLLPHAPLWALELRSTPSGELVRLFGDSRFARFGSLRLSGYGQEVFRRMSESRFARNLVALDWSYSFAGPDDLGGLCRPDAAPHLRELNLDSAKLGDSGVERLASSHLAPQLRTLSLSSNGIGPAGVAALTRPGRFGSLEVLSLGYDGNRQTREGDAMVAALTRGTFPRLRTLRLFSMGLTDAAAQALAAWPGAPELRHLQLHGDVTIRAEGVRALARSPHLQRLGIIDLFPWRQQREEIADILTGWLGAAGPVPHSTHGLRGYRPGSTVAVTSPRR